MKKFRSILLVMSILMALLLWVVTLTNPDEWRNSLSAFATSPFAVPYNAMHVFGMAFWFLGVAINTRRYKFSPLFGLKIRHSDVDIAVGLGMGAILVTNMYHVYTWHVISTILTFALALFNVVFTGPKRDILLRWVCVAVGVLAFCIGYWTDIIHFLLGEIIGMSVVAFGMLRQMYRYD